MGTCELQKEQVQGKASGSSSALPLKTGGPRGRIMWAFDPECYDVLGIVFSLPTTPTYGSCIIPPLQIWKLRLKVTGHAQIHRARQEVKELRFEAKSASLQTLLLTILPASQHTSPPFLSTPPGWQKPQRSRESLMQIQTEWTYSSGMALLVQLVFPTI